MTLKQKIFLGVFFTTSLTLHLTYGQEPNADLFATSGLTEDTIKKISLYQGYLLHKNYFDESVNYLDFDSIIEGIKQAHYKKQSLEINEKEIEEMVDQFQAYFYKKFQEDKLAEASRFLKQLAEQENIVELEKGKLYIKIVKNGAGNSVKENASVSMIWSAKTLESGKESFMEESAEPKTILLSATIPGFSKGVVGMKEGEKRILYVHPDLAYGAATTKVDPNSLMIFEVEVVKAEI